MIKHLSMLSGLALSLAFAAELATAQTTDLAGAAASKHRSNLPLPNTVRTDLITYDAKDPDSKFPPIEQLRPPKGAPNVLIVLIDDPGFGASATFGGPCQTPTLDKLAAGGLRYNRFHTTALCSPTRQALLTGRHRGHEHAVLVRRCQSGGGASNTILRNLLQSRYLPRRLDRSDQA